MCLPSMDGWQKCFDWLETDRICRNQMHIWVVLLRCNVQERCIMIVSKLACIFWTNTASRTDMLWINAAAVEICVFARCYCSDTSSLWTGNSAEVLERSFFSIDFFCISNLAQISSTAYFVVFHFMPKYLHTFSR